MNLIHNLDSIHVSCNGLIESSDVLDFCDLEGMPHLLAFGGGDILYLWNMDFLRICTALKGHGGRINAVKSFPGFLPLDRANEPESYIVTGGSDAQLILWKIAILGTNGSKKGETEMVGTRCAHYTSPEASSIISLDFHSILEDSDHVSTFFFSLSIDSRLQMIQTTKTTISLVDTISFDKRLALCLACNPRTEGARKLVFVGFGDGSLDILEVLACGADGIISESSPRMEKVHSIKMLHTGWIRSISVSHINVQDIVGGSSGVPLDPNSMLIATASQDMSVGLLSFRIGVKDQAENPISEVGGEFNTSEFVLSSGDQCRTSLYSILYGHEDWVFCVKWARSRRQPGSETRIQPLELLSCSMDRSMLIWRPKTSAAPSASLEGVYDAISAPRKIDLAIWYGDVCVGESGGDSGRFVGFCGCHWAAKGSLLVATTYTGALHVWKKLGKDSGTDEIWKSLPAPTGHNARVTDCIWSKRYEYFYTASEDKVVRVFGRWNNIVPGMSEWIPGGAMPDADTWLEVARPIIHGHAIYSITILPTDDHTLAVGAEENVVRVLTGTRKFAVFLDLFFGIATERLKERPDSAAAPALGLSNQEVLKSADVDFNTILSQRFTKGDAHDDLVEEYARSRSLVPNEDYLIQHTLWPEIGKGFGHHMELNAVASSERHVVTAGVETDCSILFWRIGTAATSLYRMEKFSVHSKAVSQMCFSIGGEFLLAISLDESLSLYRLPPAKSVDSQKSESVTFCCAENLGYGPLAACSWKFGVDSDGSNIFAVTGNSGKIGVLKVEKSAPFGITKLIEISICPQSGPSSDRFYASAIEFLYPNPLYNVVDYSDEELNILANCLGIGTSAGDLEIYYSDGGVLRRIYRIEGHDSHSALVSRIRWRKHPTPDVGYCKYQILSSSHDHSVRLFSLTMNFNK